MTYCQALPSFLASTCYVAAEAGSTVYNVASSANSMVNNVAEGIALTSEGVKAATQAIDILASETLNAAQFAQQMHMGHVLAGVAMLYLISQGVQSVAATINAIKSANTN
jgi:hypothetical protein